MPALKFWNAHGAPWWGLAFSALGLALVAAFVDVSPQVEGEFFFADDDPQMQASAQVRERFPLGDQVILRVADRGGDRAAYEASIEALTADLEGVTGATSVFSITNQDADTSPLFGRILLNPAPDATNIVLLVEDPDPEALLAELEETVAPHETAELDVVISGVPPIVEMIRRALFRDLVVFSTAAVIVFALLIGLLYRDPTVVVGTLATCLAAVSVTLLTVTVMGVPIGLLTANLVTIVFVLTLSHVVFLTGNWRLEAAATLSRDEALVAGVRRTMEASFWSMMTTFLGFLSLLVATARPLRELGVAGAVGTVTALVVAYAVYPTFLARWAKVPGQEDEAGATAGRAAAWGPVAAVAGVVLVIGIGAPQLDTDPSLLSYFDESSPIREGIDQIDADGGTSTLDIVVRAPGGGDVAERESYAAMESLQEALEADPDVGVVLSPPVLIGHGRSIPLARFLPVPMLFDIASSDQLDRVGLGFVTPDREEAKFSLRMRETPASDREVVLARMAEHVENAGLESVVIAGLYDLQAQLGRLIASSLRIGIGGLLLLFLIVASVVSRDPRVAGTMWICLFGIPAVILGTFGHLGIAVDIITSPAANIALAIGADSMIHLAVRARTLSAAGEAAPWSGALGQVGGSVLRASGIICAGFGIFVLSSFPPTQRFGLAVIVGTIAAASLALIALPRLAGAMGSRADSAGASAA